MADLPEKDEVIKERCSNEIVEYLFYNKYKSIVKI